MERHPDDPRGLIAEAYRIEGIAAEDCRAIFFDWALGLPQDIEPPEAARTLIDAYAPPAEHPMTRLLQEAASGTGAPGGRRRGGRRKRE